MSNFMPFLKESGSEDFYNDKVPNEMLKSLVDKLTPRQKEIFQLSRYEGLSHDQIAKELNEKNSYEDIYCLLRIAYYFKCIYAEKDHLCRWKLTRKNF